MEPQSNMPSLQPATSARLFERRKGQKRARQLAEERDRAALVCAFPTGYGKTLTAIDVYCERRRYGINRLLVLVPSDELRKQWAEKAGGYFAKLGEPFSKAIAVDTGDRAYRYHSRDLAEVFIASYQQVNRDQKSWFEELTETGSWMVVNDEGHHLGVGLKWGHDAERRIRRDFTLMLSAKPYRSDGRAIIGVEVGESHAGEQELRPDVVVTWKEALAEGAIRPVRGHIANYWLDVLTPGDDAPMRITAASLRDEGITDFNAYEARRGLRYLQKYVAPMLNDAIGRLAEKNTLHPSEHQMLVFAMTNRHAESVCSIIRSLTCSDGFADWVGQARSKTENDAAIARFLGYQEIEGKRHTLPAHDRLPCLVNVDMIGEGFDNDRVSVAVFLNLVRAPSKVVQQIGRTLRRNAHVEPLDIIPPQIDQSDVYASEDSPIGEYVATLEVEAGDIREQGDDSEEETQREDALIDIPEVRVMDADFIDKRVVLSDGASRLMSRSEQEQELTKLGFSDVEVRKMLDAIRPNGAGAAPAYSSEMEALTFWRQQVERSTTLFTSNAIKLLSRRGSIERSLAGDVKRLVNGQWLRLGGARHDAAMADDLQKKNDWLIRVNRQMKETREVPAWLTV